MKPSRIFLVALLVGTLGVLGCGDDDNGGGTAGTGGSGTGGSGGIVDSATACGGADCQGEEVQRAACEREYNLCLEVNPKPEECLAGAEVFCGNI
jgi:hypothetical protein